MRALLLDLGRVRLCFICQCRFGSVVLVLDPMGMVPMHTWVFFDRTR